MIITPVQRDYDNNVPGWMRQYELNCLGSLAANVPNHGMIVEIGSFLGRSACAWAHYAASGVDICCIDPWSKFEVSRENLRVMDHPESFNPDQSFYEQFRNNTKAFPKVHALRGESPNVEWPLPSVDKPMVDLVFLDALHDATMINDMKVWTKRIKPGGILAGHDHSSEFPEVMLTVDFWARRHNTFYSLFGGTSIWFMVIK